MVPGKGTVIITGVGNYTGTMTPSVAFYIVPGRPPSRRWSPAPRATLTWRANAGVDGYQIVCAAGTSATYNPLGVVAGLTRTVKGLKTGVTYRFMVRAFKVIDARRFYGASSTTKGVKVK